MLKITRANHCGINNVIKNYDNKKLIKQTQQKLHSRDMRTMRTHSFSTMPANLIWHGCISITTANNSIFTSLVLENEIVHHNALSWRFYDNIL